MLYGHRRDPRGYAAALEQTDAWLADLLPRLSGEDVLILTADHGNDPTFRGTDHTREFVPLLVHAPGLEGGPLDQRSTFADVGQTIAEALGLGPVLPHGRSFLDEVRRALRVGHCSNAHRRT